MRWSGIHSGFVLGIVALAGCSTGKPFLVVGSTAQSPGAPVSPSPAPVAASDPGTVSGDSRVASGVASGVDSGVNSGVDSGVLPKPKPFIAVPSAFKSPQATPSTLLLEHAVLNSQIPLSEYASQPVHLLTAFNLRFNLSAAEVQKEMGSPAGLADNDDPWLVYRLTLNRELWLHFAGPLQDHLDAADVVRGAEDGYVRDRVFSADDGH